MLGSGILDFAIGLVFTFLAMSLAAGAATEAFASFLKTRSTTLLQGVKDLLNDQEFEGLAARLYQHGLINPRGDGTADNRKNDPAYIDPNQFAAALLDIVKGLPNTAPPADSPAQPPAADPAGPAAVTALNARIANAPGDASGQIRKMLYGIVARAQGDEARIRTELSSWFNNSMDRVSGVYKRWSQLYAFGFALLIAIALNVSTIDIAQRLWKQPPDTRLMAATNLDATTFNDKLTMLETLPLGWTPQLLPQIAEGASVGGVVLAWAIWLGLHLVGWVITAFATLFGAPFWFDTLQQIVRLKGSGPSPAEKGTSAAAGK
jgi:hypothetical protein